MVNEHCEMSSQASDSLISIMTHNESLKSIDEEKEEVDLIEIGNDLLHTVSSRSSMSTKEMCDMGIKHTRWRSYLAIAVSLLTLAFISVSIAGIVHYTADKKHKSTEYTESCLTPECVMASSRLLETADMEVDPCEDFFRYSCGGFLDKHYLKAKQGSVSTFGEVSYKLEAGLFKVVSEEPRVEKSSRQSVDLGLSESDAIMKGKRFFQECMNTTAIDERGLSPLLDIMNATDVPKLLEADDVYDADVASIQSNNRKERAIFQAIRNLHDYGVPIFVQYFVKRDDANSTEYMFDIRQGSLGGLPSREYYLESNSTERFTRVFENYREIVKIGLQLLELNGISIRNTSSTTESDPFEEYVDKIVNIETKIAQCHVPQSHFSFPVARYNRMTPEMADSLFPLGWRSFLKESSNVEINESGFNINVETPSALLCIKSTLLEMSPHEISTYMKYYTLLHFQDYLGTPFRNWYLHLHSLTTGVRYTLPRWRECMAATSVHYGYAIGRAFIEDNFDKNDKYAVSDMVNEIRQAFIERLPDLKWMDQTTRRAAIEKALALQAQIGYPDWIMDDEKLSNYYSNYEVYDGKYFETMLSSHRENFVTNMEKLSNGSAINDWELPPIVMNAYYNAVANQVVFPAGMFHPPFLYNSSAPQSLNYGSLGAIIGHEFTHGFDSSGRKYDSAGNLDQWWTSNSSESFEAKTACFVDQYSNYSHYGHYHNGNLTLVENIADNGGLQLAFRAFQEREKTSKSLTLPGTPWSPEQLFFVGFAQVWCSSHPEEKAIRQMTVGPHSIPASRVNGAVSNSRDFAEAFQCKAKTKMNPEEKCQIW